jgi:tetratricopeptide (TPR) repeat protein
MKRIHLRAALVFACLAVVASASTSQAKDKWINLTTKNFNIISNAEESDTRKLALKLEQFHYVFSKLFNLPQARPIPTTVMVFKNDGAFKPYKPLYNGKPSNVAGYFQPGQDENLIALDISANTQRPMSVIYHEYTHLLTSSMPREWPIWLKEGIAEVYSSFDVKDNKVTLGAPIDHHVFLLRDSKFIPLQTLFNVQHESAFYNERDKQSIFYSESWALCHYLMFGDKNARRQQMVDFINRYIATGDLNSSFTQSLKADLPTVEKQLRGYIGNSGYTINVYTLSSTEGETEMSVKPVTDAEATFYLGNLLARTNRIDEGEVLFKQAIALDPEMPRSYEGLGLVALRRNNFDQAMEQFKQAATRGSRNHLAHYYYAEALQRRAVGPLTSELAQQVADELKTSIKLMPGFAHAYYALGFLSLSTGQSLKEGAEHVKTAMRLEPQTRHYALTLAQIQARMQDYDAAKKTLEPLMAQDAEPSLKVSAESIMSMIEYASRSGNVGAFTRPPDPPGSPAGSTSSPPRLVRRPSLRFEGAKTIRGVLTAVECNNGKWTLVVNTATDLLRFMVSDKEKLEFFSQDPSFEGAVNCGSVNKIAFIYFKPIEGESKFAGDAVAVEFTTN